MIMVVIMHHYGELQVANSFLKLQEHPRCQTKCVACLLVVVETPQAVRPVPRLFLPGILEPDTYRSSAADGDYWGV